MSDGEGRACCWDYYIGQTRGQRASCRRRLYLGFDPPQQAQPRDLDQTAVLGVVRSTHQSKDPFALFA